ncbi:MAG: hypothetical protein ACD_37C00697G0003 [uncultured bacterium]|nr:MAG: hypothetical protein ACD_37C00697G0003 [uncultured bacterium]OGH14454.1 MAG: hypothetical protein A2687_03575 [Candidatus Levybacteria bacterium RIFCSPHIGHO2_01_FULL_38_26]
MYFNKAVLFKTLPLMKFFIVLIFIFSTIIFLKTLTYDYYPDFSSYYYGSIAVFDGENPYLGGEKYFTPFVYPPPVLLFFLPFTLLPYFIAEKMFAILSILCLLLSVVLIFKIFKLTPFSLLGLFLTILVFNFFPVKFTLGMGQINNVVLLMVTLFVYFHVKKRELMSGLFLAIAIALKLFPVLLIIYLIFSKRWKALLSVILTTIAITLVTFIFIDPKIISYFLTTALPSLLASWKADYYNQSLSAFLIRELGNLELVNIVRPVISAILITASLSFVWIFRRNDKSGLLSISLLITLSLIVNTFSWQHHFVWLLIPLFIVFHFIRSNHFGTQYYFVLGISYLLMAVNMKNFSMFPTFFQSHVLYGALILYILNVNLLTKNIK